jgi:hypothetical protein
MLTNPFFADKLNPGPTNIFIPTNKVNVLSQAFLQYTIPHKLQATAGRISMDTPWIKTTTNSPMTNATFQGGMADIELNQQLTSTGLYINTYKGIAESRFTHNTMDTLTNNTLINPNPGEAGLDMTMAFGVDYRPTDTLRTQIWGYAFKNYVSMLYADGKQEIPIDDDQSMFFDFQGSIQSDLLIGESIASKLKLGSPNSKMLGAQFTYRYRDIDLGASSNVLFADSNSFQQGGMISPYTYNLANDPLYTTSFRSGMVEKGGGGAFKIFSLIKAFGNKLTIKPSLAHYNNTGGITSNVVNLLTGYTFEGSNIHVDSVYSIYGANNIKRYNNMLQFRSSYAF